MGDGVNEITGDAARAYWEKLLAFQNREAQRILALVAEQRALDKTQGRETDEPIRCA